jgi:hypothetical protein
MRTTAFTAFLFVLAVSAAGCGKDYKYAGDECVASSECAEGLVCDLGQTPAVCAEMTTDPPDAAPTPIDGPPGTIDAPPTPIDGPPTPIDGPPTPIDAPMIDAQPIDATPIDAMP